MHLDISQVVPSSARATGASLYECFIQEQPLLSDPWVEMDLVPLCTYRNNLPQEYAQATDRGLLYPQARAVVRIHI